ncbi:MAG TPA: glycosyltransferase [Pyrinomonadaceae bacterium]|nr:glycosyltransferase [Pyrinomonadaceae bacterium]
MNVLHLIGSFDCGGSETQAVQLAKLQQAHGTKVHLACFDRRGPMLKEAEALVSGDLPEFPLRGFYHPHTAVQLTRFVRMLRHKRIDVLHTHDFYTNVFGLFGGMLAGVPARIGSRRETFGFRSDAQKRFERLAYGFAHAVVCNSIAVQRQLVREGVAENKTAVVYNGLDLQRVKPSGLTRAEIMAQLGFETSDRLVTIVANMRHPVKDQSTFLKAAARVVQAVPDTSFVLAGEGELKEQYSELARTLGLGDKAIFPGRVDRIADLLEISDVCVLSSRAEGFSNSILEYMAAGRPTVATDVGGAAEAIHEGTSGYLVPAGDDELMAERIIWLLQDPANARAMGEKGRQIVIEKFSCEAQRARCEELYQQVLTEKRAPARDGSNPSLRAEKLPR